MNFFCGTAEITGQPGESLKIYGGQYAALDAFIGSEKSKDFSARLLCYDIDTPKLRAFMSLKPGQRVLIGGTFRFQDDLNAPWDVIIHTLETNIQATTYMNHAMLGGAKLTRTEIKARNDGETYAKKLSLNPGTDDSTSLIDMEIGKSRLAKLQAIESGRENRICVCGHLRAWKPDDSERVYRYIRGVDFNVRAAGKPAAQSAPATGSSVGQSAAEEDPMEDWAS